jgi:hypothetical protein
MSGVLSAGESIDITSILGPLLANQPALWGVLGGVCPFANVDLDAGHYDDRSATWPRGELGGYLATRLFVAEPSIFLSGYSCAGSAVVLPP